MDEEKEKMFWDNFWTSGKTQDYIDYRNHVKKQEVQNVKENTRTDTKRDEYR